MKISKTKKMGQFERVKIEFGDKGFIESSSVESFILYEILQELKEVNKALVAINNNIMHGQ